MGQTNANTRRGLGRRPSSRCSRENHPDCRLSTSKFKTLDAAVKHSRLKWAKSASVKGMVRSKNPWLMAPQEVRAHCDPVTQTGQPKKLKISGLSNLRFQEVSLFFMFLVCLQGPGKSYPDFKDWRRGHNSGHECVP